MLKCKQIQIEIASLYRIKLEHKIVTGLSVNQDIDFSEIVVPNKSILEAVECLTHFAVEKFGMALVDLRPIQVDKDKIMITEPILFSNQTNRFSSADMGTKGIEHFKQEHKCSSICKHLELKKF